MIKKVLIGTAITAVIGTFVFGRDVLSYARTAGSSIRDAVRSEVPLDFEVNRARRMVQNLMPDIRKCMHVIAEQQVEVEHSSDEVDRKTGELDRQKKTILALRSDLKRGGSFVYSGRNYTSDEVRRDLAQRFARYKVAVASLERDRKILVARKTSLRANEEKLDKMMAARQELQVQVAQLEARLKTLQAAQTVSTLKFDDSRLTRAQKLISQLNKQLDVEQRLLDSEGRFTGLIPVDTPAEPGAAGVADDIDNYFGSASGSSEGTTTEPAGL